MALREYKPIRRPNMEEQLHDSGWSLVSRLVRAEDPPTAAHVRSRLDHLPRPSTPPAEDETGSNAGTVAAAVQERLATATATAS